MNSVLSYIDPILIYELLDNSVLQYVVALLLFVFFRLNVKVFNKFVIKKIHHFTQWKHLNFGILLINLLSTTPKYFLRSLYVYIPLKVLTIPSEVDRVIDVIFITFVALQLIRIANAVIVYAIQTIFTDNDNDDVDKTSQNVIQLIVKIIVWVIGLLMLLLNFGVEVTPLVASLWVWGIAVAFALQSILQDMFSSFSIFFDKPFKVWDFVVLWNDMGTVTNISLKSTRIKALQWPELIIPNKEVTSTRIVNYANIVRRRVRMNIWVTYETPQEKLKNIPLICEEIVSSHEHTSFNRCVFKEYGNCSLDFEIVFYTEVVAYKDHLLIREDVNYHLFEKFAEEWISFAYPTQTIHMVKDKNITEDIHDEHEIWDM